ncbi:hypothetical protein [Actinomadura sp. 9N407]|uniref:hypothetical protein n=1 Tax=Actinomadura sp. 9N407 TaxID=3375154 RepID=UPI003798FEC3
MLLIALSVNAVAITVATVSRHTSKPLSWGVAFPGVVAAILVAAIGLGSLASGFAFLLLPAAIGMYIVPMYVATHKTPLSGGKSPNGMPLPPPRSASDG